jgi:NTE family protein
MTPITKKPIDLVLAGGGVKGVGLVGAVVKLMDAGYRAYRVAGTSAGSLVGAIVAAAAKDDQLTGEQVKELALSINYRKFLDPGPVESVPLLGPAWGILQGSGIYKGDYAHDFIAGQLKNLGVKTFGDLRLDDDQLPEERRYRLVVTAADVTTGQLVRLPWDYRRVYGLDPDEQPVADAVRASMSIPFFFRPLTLTGTTGLTSTLIDGGLLSNYPIDSLDRLDGKRPR